jgi:hypothetical protein
MPNAKPSLNPFQQPQSALLDCKKCQRSLNKHFQSGMDQNKGFVIRKIAEACLKNSYLYFSKITGLHSDYYLFFIALNMGQT